MCEATFKFTPPPEAPVFWPSLKEFEDPLLYLEKIRPIGSKTGICKIIPPKGWNPPFAVDVNTFRFTPRIQRLYELEAHSRLKLDFIGKLYQFFRLQGMEKLKIPNVGGRYLDVFWLHKHVMNAGGFEKVNSAKLWPHIAERMGYPANKFAMIMKTNYEKLLLKYELVVSAHPLSGVSGKRSSNKDNNKSTPVKRTRLHVQEDDTKIDYTASKELKNLQFFGPGPKAAVPIGEIAVPSKSKQENTINRDQDDVLPQFLSVGDYLCRVCDLGNNEASLLICSTSTCQACYHTYCLTPPLGGVPHYQWKCPECVRAICSRPMDSFGFPQSSRSYTLHEFGVRADAFKAKYFKKEPTSVPCAEVEQEFWRILQEYTEDVVVEYGADVHASDQGSGFPTEQQLARAPHLFASAEQRRQALVYAQSPWNLNNLPVYGNSVLRFIKGNVDGMKVPWCYVGMVFSTFCWHIEDHWSCSINFNHWGEPKTWYGVSSADAELFERAMRKQAGELFDLSPDLLHHITTIMNPNLLQAEGVPIYRTDQHCGEFVVTFPRAYHAGFNQGFNFAEAVNVCPPAWLPIGRACVEHYAEMHRQCVFSNDELLFRLAEVIAGRREMVDCANYTEMAAERFRDRESASCTGFEAEDLRVIHDEFATVVGREVCARRRLLPLCGRAVQFRIDCMSEHGASAGAPAVSGDEDVDDDARICAVCQTTLFFSAIACPCKASYLTADDSCSPQILGRKRGSTPAAPSCADGKPKHAFMVCLEHSESVCERCPLSQCTLYYTHSLDELEEMRDTLAARMAAYADWRRKFTPFFLPDASSTPSLSTSTPAIAKVTLENFEKQVKDARLFGYHTDQLYKRANNYLQGVKDLLRVCELAADFVLGRYPPPATISETAGSEAIKPQRSQQKQKQKQEQDQHLLEFQIKRQSGMSSSKGGGGGGGGGSGPGKTVTHILHRCIDLNSPREPDFLSLLEAVELEEAAAPIDLTRKLGTEGECEGEGEGEGGSEDEVLPSVASLRRLFHQRLPMWRAEVLAAVEKDAVQHKGLEHSSVTYLQPSLAMLVCQLRDEFPGWCEHSEEVKIVSLMEEVCRRISDLGEGSSGNGNKYCSLPGLGDHLAQSRQLSSRLSSVLAADGAGKDGDGGSLRTIATRRHRGDGDVDANGSATNAPPPPTVTVACRSLLEQLKDLLDTAISRDLHIFTQAKSALLELAEVVEVLHLTELTVRSSLSSVKRIVDSLSSSGVYNVGEEQGEKNLANLVNETGLTRCLTACLAAPTASDHQRHHPRGVQTRAVAEVDEAEVASTTARLIFGWCVQVTKHCLPLKEASTCPDNRQAWLSYLSDLLVIEKFIFGNCDIEGGNSSGAIPSELMRCRRDLDAFSDFHLSSFRNLASRFLDKTESVLPVDLFSNFLEAVVASPIEDDTLTQLHQAAFKQDAETFERLLKNCSDAMNVKIRAALTNATISSLCPVCRDRLGLTEFNMEPVDDCPLCPFLLARQAITTVAPPDLKKGMNLGFSDLSGQASGILSCAVTKCALFVENRHYSWLRQVDSVLLQNSEVVSQFLSRQPKTFIDELPDSLKNTASMLCTQNTKSVSSAASFQGDLLVLIVEGQALPGVTVAPPTILQLLRGLLAL